MNEQLGITTSWGIPADPISKQLRELGIELGENKERFYDKIKKYINYLSLSLIFTDSQMLTLIKRANRALTKDIQSSINNMSDTQLRELKNKLNETS